MKLIKTNNLLCPIDGHAIEIKERQMLCDNGHSFDIAKQGYTNLLLVQNKKSKSPGDSKEMVDARRAFLDSGAYEQIAQGLIALFDKHAGEQGEHLAVLDAGCGEGYYLGQLAKYLDQWSREGEASLIGLDISKPAVMAAARKYKNIEWVVGSNRQKLVADGSLDFVLCMFGFPCYPEFKVALKEKGLILLADAGPRHLIELRELIYPEVKQKPIPNLESAELTGFKLVESKTVKYQIELDSQETINNLMLMTPHFFKASHEGRESVSKLTHLKVTVDVVFRVLGL